MSPLHRYHRYHRCAEEGYTRLDHSIVCKKKDFRPHFGGKGSETQVSEHILEERGLKPRFWTAF